MLGEKVKKYRCERNMTKAELSRRTGLSVRSIEFIEKGKVYNPTLNTLIRLATTFGVKVEDLIS